MRIHERQAGDRIKLTQLVRKQRDAEQRDRLRAAALALAGRETGAIQAMLERSRAFVQRWAYAYRDKGIAGVARIPYPGPGARFPRQREQELRARLDPGPRPRDKVCTLRGNDVQRILDEEFGVKYSLQAVYDTLHRLGYSCLAPRPRHEKHNPAEQKQFQEQLAPLLSAS